MKGITLEVGTVVVLSLDGTLVYVEDVQPTYAAVVALPEQDAARTDERVFTPGKVGAKKISPYSQADKAVALKDLSDRNKEFIGTFEVLREKHGPHFVQRSPEEIAAMSVTKAGPTRTPKDPNAPVSTKRRNKRAGAGPKYLQRCTDCGEQPGHPNHGPVSPTHAGRHVFVAPAAIAEPAAAKVTTAKVRQPAAGATIYTLVSSDLSKAKAQPRGDKFNDGNRSHRVVLALSKLPNASGILDDVIRSIANDGGKPMTNPAKVVRRTLGQLVKPDFGSCVVRAGAAEPDDSETDD